MRWKISANSALVYVISIRHNELVLLVVVVSKSKIRDIAETGDTISDHHDNETTGIDGDDR